MQGGEDLIDTLTCKQLENLLQLPSQISEIRSEIAKLSTKIDLMQETQRKLSNRYSNSDKKLSDHNATIEKILVKIESLESSNEQTRKEYCSLKKDLKSLKDQLTDLKTDIAKLSTELKLIKTYDERSFLSRENVKVGIFAIIAGIVGALATEIVPKILNLFGR